MISSWKLTKKLKDFSRSKSPAASSSSSRDDQSSIDSGSLPKIVLSSSSESNDQVSNSKGYAASKASSIYNESESRRQTIVPSSNSLNDVTFKDKKSQIPSSQSSSKTVSSNLNQDNSLSQSSINTSEKVNSFKPGLLTIKIYHGSNFKIPFDINLDKSSITRLINSSSDNRSSATNSGSHSNKTEEHLLKQLESLSVHEEDKINSDLSSSLIPASITLNNPSIQSLIKSSLIYFTLEFDKTIVSIDADGGTISEPVFNRISQFDVTKLSNELKFQVFLKLPSVLTDKGDEPEPQSITSQDVLISSKTLQLRFDNINNPIRLKSHDSIKLDNEYSSNYNLGIHNGELIISIDFKPNQNKHLTIDDFDLLKVIGKGSFGKVMQVKKKDSGKIYALKAIRKSHIVSKGEVLHTLAERTVLANVNNPFIVPLKFSFQSQEKLYFVLNFINGGELFYHLQRSGKFDLVRSRFYTCELLSALECLHSMDVIYRDLKPENILLDYKGHIALCDFGLCKLNMKNDDQTQTFCGTPEYLAPELLLGQGYTKSVDWWTLGVLLYEMLTGLPPYYDEDTNKMYQKILRDPLKFPDNFDRDAKDLLIKLLSRDPKYRLGNNGAWEIQQHAFFNKIDWVKLNNKQYLPPFKPPVKDNFDTSNFDKEFTSELPVDSVVNDYLSDSVQRQFGGWTYVGTEHLGESKT